MLISRPIICRRRFGQGFEELIEGEGWILLKDRDAQFEEVESGASIACREVCNLEMKLWLC
jgi:hypothetical protein